MRNRMLAAAAIACLVVSGLVAAAEGKAKYVFVFIGDGTSFPQRNAAEFFKANQNSPRRMDDLVARAEKKLSKDQGITDFAPTTERLVMNTFPAQGISTTYSYNSLITDSSSSGTAIATGNKTRDGVVGMDPEARVKFTSMAKLAKVQGKKVGILTTVSLDHATPAAFYACQPHRNSYYEISLQAPQTGFDFFGGGGFKQPKGAKGDQRDLYEYLDEAGYKVYKNRAGFDSIQPGAGKLVTINPILDADDAMPYTIDRGEGEITLAEFVDKAVKVLDNPDGFFIMAEGGKVDWACHANDALAAIQDVLAFDAAVAVAHEFYKKHPDETLIVVTGDHETGGMTVGFAGTRYDTFLDRIASQKGSYLAFNKVVADMRKEGPITMDRLYPVMEDFFGLIRYDADELKRLNEQAASGDIEAVRKLEYALQPYEIETIDRSLAMTNTPAKERPLGSDAYYMNYGSYEPVTIALTHTLNHKAGIGWTTFSHTGLPTPVSAIGVQCEKFMGHYDNTDIFKKVVAIAGY